MPSSSAPVSPGKNPLWEKLIYLLCELCSTIGRMWVHHSDPNSFFSKFCWENYSWKYHNWSDIDNWIQYFLIRIITPEIILVKWQSSTNLVYAWVICSLGFAWWTIWINEESSEPEPTSGSLQSNLGLCHVSIYLCILDSNRQSFNFSRIYKCRTGRSNGSTPAPPTLIQNQRSNGKITDMVSTSINIRLPNLFMLTIPIFIALNLFF